MSMWDTLDRLINKPQPPKLAQISPALVNYHEASKGLGEDTDFYQWLNGVEGINLGAFVKTGIVSVWDAEGFIKEQFRKFSSLHATYQIGRAKGRPDQSLGDGRSPGYSHCLGG